MNKANFTVTIGKAERRVSTLENYTQEGYDFLHNVYKRYVEETVGARYDEMRDEEAKMEPGKWTENEVIGSGEEVQFIRYYNYKRGAYKACIVVKIY